MDQKMELGAERDRQERESRGKMAHFQITSSPLALADSMNLSHTDVQTAPTGGDIKAVQWPQSLTCHLTGTSDPHRVTTQPQHP